MNEVKTNGEIAWSQIKGELEDSIYEETKGIVQSGPFKDMKMLREMTRSDGGLSPMLLGCHERELHGIVEREIVRLTGMESPLVVNVGCAEGYYAVGLKRRLPHARVWALDIDEEALRLTRETAALNDVELTVSTELKEVWDLSPDLIVMDCEGAEIVYLNLHQFPQIKSAHIIVELHHSAEVKVADILAQHWGEVDDIFVIYESWRNPNDFEFLRQSLSLYRWLAMCEGRPCQMAWFYMTPKREA